MDKIPVEVVSISNSAPYEGYIVILKEIASERCLPIVVGVAEAHNILLLLKGQRFIRPLTYDLLVTMLKKSNAEVKEITITDLKDQTFFAEIQLMSNGEYIEPIDARPSDSIAIALRTSAPIFVNRQVMLNAGFISETPLNLIAPFSNNIDKIKDLNKKLSTAVELEEYEDAAMLRDQIKELIEKENIPED